MELFRKVTTPEERVWWTILLVAISGLVIGCLMARDDRKRAPEERVWWTILLVVIGGLVIGCLMGGPW